MPGALLWLGGALVPLAMAFVVTRWIARAARARSALARYEASTASPDAEPPSTIDHGARPGPMLVAIGAAAVLAAIAVRIVARASAWTGLSTDADVSGTAVSLLYTTAFVAPLYEAAKALAVWPVVRRAARHDARRLVVYAVGAALGFAAVENAVVLRAHPHEGLWLARVCLSLPADLFFAAAWGYALVRTKRPRRPGRIFGLVWTATAAMHALYMHLVYGRGSGALVATAPLLVAMATTTWLFLRSPATEEQRSSRPSWDGGRPSLLSSPPSLQAMRQALARADRPILLRWIAVGALVTIGAMIVGLVAAVAVGHVAHIDFSTVDERDVRTTGPVVVLGIGLLVAFPVGGFLVARAAGVPTLLEPALAIALAIVVTLGALGLAAPVALVFALAFAPVAWALGCAGAWLGRANAG